MTTNDTTRKRCAATVRQVGGWNHDRPCFRPAKFHEEGKDWCGTHAPSKVAVRDAKQRVKWEAERAARDLRWEIEAQERKVLDAAVAWASNETTGDALVFAVDALRALYAQRDGTVAP